MIDSAGNNGTFPWNLRFPNPFHPSLSRSNLELNHLLLSNCSQQRGSPEDMESVRWTSGWSGLVPEIVMTISSVLVFFFGQKRTTVCFINQTPENSNEKLLDHLNSLEDSSIWCVMLFCLFPYMLYRYVYSTFFLTHAFWYIQPVRGEFKKYESTRHHTCDQPVILEQQQSGDRNDNSQLFDVKILPASKIPPIRPTEGFVCLCW